MNLESGIFFAFGAMLCWGIGDFLIQRSTRKVGDLHALTFIGLIGTLGLLPFAIKEFPLLWNTSNILLLLALGIVTFISAIFNLEALKQGKLSIIDVVFEIELPITIALSLMFFRESLTSTEWLLVSLILIGIILIATKSFSHWKTRLERGVVVAFIAAIFMGLVNFLTASSAKTVSPLMAIWGSWVIFTIFCLIVIAYRKDFRVFFRNGIEYKWLLLGMGIFDTLAWICYSFAVFRNEIAIITAITEAYPAIALFLGVWFNKEKIRWYQYLGAVLALGASFILALTL